LLTGGLDNDVFVFTRGDGGGDTIFDFAGNDAAVGDSLRFSGYGTAAAGASFTQVGSSNIWLIASSDGTVFDYITFDNNASIHTTDYVFV
jgi:hypothetical protein